MDHGLVCESVILLSTFAESTDADYYMMEYGNELLKMKQEGILP